MIALRDVKNQLRRFLGGATRDISICSELQHLLVTIAGVTCTQHDLDGLLVACRDSHRKHVIVPVAAGSSIELAIVPAAAAASSTDRTGDDAVVVADRRCMYDSFSHRTLVGELLSREDDLKQLKRKLVTATQHSRNVVRHSTVVQTQLVATRAELLDLRSQINLRGTHRKKLSVVGAFTLALGRARGAISADAAIKTMGHGEESSSVGLRVKTQFEDNTSYPRFDSIRP